MRRSGGSRSPGGGFGGGSGGMGGHSGRIASRMHSSSHRHHMHRMKQEAMYRNHRQYNRHYNRYSSLHGNSTMYSAFIGLILIFGLFSGFSIAANMSSSTQEEITLAGGTSFDFEYNQFSHGSVSVSVTDGKIDTYFFETIPAYNHTSSVNESFNGTLTDNGDANPYETYGLSLTGGSEIQVNWEANESLTYYIIKGQDNLEKWKNGENDASFYNNYGKTGTHEYSVPGSGTYFFAVESRTNDNFYTIEFDLDIPVHDLSEPIIKESGTHEFAESDIDGESIIVHNPSDSDFATVVVQIDATFGYGTVFLVYALIILTIVFGLRKIRNRKVAASNRSHLQRELDKSRPTSYKNKKDPKYITRPDAEFCMSCGSGVLPDAQFCTECGTALPDK